MARRGNWSSLESLARTRAAKMTIIAIHNVLVQEEFESTHERRRSGGEHERKRRHSCGDDEGFSIRKKVRREEDSRQVVESAGSKRAIENTEAHGRAPKRQKVDGISDAAEAGSCVESRRENSKDDIGVTYYTASDSMFHVLKEYFVRLSPAMWNDYGKSLVGETLKKMRSEGADGKYLRKAIEYTLSEKLCDFSTAAIEDFSSGLEGVIYEKLRHCRRLSSLEMTVIPRDDRDLVNATLSFRRLGHLQSLSLLPPLRYSFHWAVGEVARHCTKLRELKVVYNGDHFDDDDEGIACLGSRVSLGALWLFNIGRRSEARRLVEVLRALPDLKVLFHKELPNAILELAGSSKLRLERVDLCWYQRGLGYQLVYLPSSYLLKMAEACPGVRLLNLVGPPCLARVVASLPRLQAVVLHQASLASCLRRALRDVGMEGVTELRVSDAWDVTHDLISAVAGACPSLRVLSITASSLEAKGDLLPPPRRRPAFPCLLEAALAPAEPPRGRPAPAPPPLWQLGAALTAYLLGGASLLTSLRLRFRGGDIPPGDVPSEGDLGSALLCGGRPRPALRRLALECPPAASPRLLQEVLRACPALTALAGVATWPMPAHQRAALTARHYPRLDIS